jgi:hypothetical protein
MLRDAKTVVHAAKGWAVPRRAVQFKGATQFSPTFVNALLMLVES